MGCFFFLCLLISLFFQSQFTSSSLPSFNSSLTQLCSRDDYFALLQFKNSLTIAIPLERGSTILLERRRCDFYNKCRGSSIPKTNFWNESTDCCTWDGVTCDNMTGHVIGLDLSFSLILNTTLHSNSSLFLLRHLQQLNLAENSFVGQIPLELSYLSKLVSLDLSYSSLEIGKQQFESLVQNLTDLRELDLKRVNLSAVDPYSLKNLSSSLTSLRLSGCGIRGKLPENVFRLPNLHELFLYENEELNYYFPRGNWSSPLKFLDLSSTKSSGKLWNSIGNLKDLTYLDLSQNNIHGSLPASLGNLTLMTRLNLSQNNLTGSLPASLGNLTLITRLDLSQNNLTGLIPSSITNLTQLVFLNLSHNKLAGFVPSDITWQNPNLVYLYLNDNELNGTLHSWFYYLPSLTTLKLNSNRLTGHINEFRYRTLNLIDLHNNKLSGVFPPSICNMTDIQLLDLSNNLFSGSIPPCLYTSLSVLNLGRNRFHGIIPPMFEPECRLQTFDVGENQLEGSIPRSLANCKRLEVLNLGKNNIVDTFPFWLDILSELQVLVLKSNRFHGPILRQSPKNISAFSELNIIDLSYNNFNGKIPSEFFERMNSMTAISDSKSGITYMGSGYYYDDYYFDSVTLVNKGKEMKLERILTIFKAVDISNNHFEGEIPKSVGNLKSLRALNFSGNGFTGLIPSSFGNLSELESLDLSNNKLSGEIPTQLTGLTFLSHFDVSQNDLVGTIPRGKQFETFSNTSYEKNSGLCGPPLLKKCGNTEEPPSPPSTSKDNQSSYKLGSTVYDWIVVVMGYVSGLVIGLVGGTFIFDKKKAWFMKILSMGRRQRGKRINKNKRNIRRR